MTCNTVTGVTVSASILLVSALCNFSEWAGSQRVMLHSSTSHTAPNISDFFKTGSYFMETMVSGLSL